MAKKTKLIEKAQKAAAASAKPKADNPFDKFANARKKHDVLNRKVKGEDRNVGRARAKAIDERKTKLLKDLKQSKRSNVIIDKRFGENDPTMSVEEKMFLRFQKERMKKTRNSSMYHLDEDEDHYGGGRGNASSKTQEVLTHKGQILGESNVHDHDWISSDDEANEMSGRLDRDVVNQLHFGGGLVEKKASELSGGLVDQEQGDMMTKKGRLDALQEIVMKSKMFKMQRKEAKEDQENERERLDKDFDELFRGKAIEMDMKFNRSKRDNASAMDGGENGTNEPDDYDKLMAEMMYEAKVQPTDRTKTDEEIALAERERVEELEKARLKRMREIADGDVRGNKASNKKRVKNDDELDDFGMEEYTPNNKPQQQQKASSDDEEDEEDEEDDEDEDHDDWDSDNDDEDDDDEEEEEDDDDDEEDGDNDEEDGEGEDDDDEEDEVEAKGRAEIKKKQPKEDEEEEFSEDEEEEEEEQGRRSKRYRRMKNIQVDETRLEMPHKIECPNDFESFEQLLDKYVTNEPDDSMELINRIVKWNNVHLPGSDGIENKKLMHNFLDILFKYFVRLGDSLVDEEHENEEVKTKTMRQLDHLTMVIFQICRDLKESSIQLWSRTLKIFYAQLQKSMRDYVQGVKESCWPSLGKLLFFQLLGHCFSVSDLKNDIVFAASVFLCQCLVQCPVTSMRDLVSGLMCCSILAEYNEETVKLIPEVNSFLVSVMSMYLPSASSSSSSSSVGRLLSTFKVENLSFLRERLSNVKSGPSCVDGKPMIPWKTFAAMGSKLDHLEDCLDNVCFGVISSVYRLLNGFVIPKFVNETAFREWILPIEFTLAVMRPQDKPKFPTVLQKDHLSLLESVNKSMQQCVSERIPLQWRKAVKNVVESKAPKFDAHYTMKKDQDPDKDRVKLKQLGRQLKREKKAAMRELRRDSAFIDQERFKEVQAANQARREERHKNFAWLEEQQATINEQVKSGKGLLKGGGSGVAKKPRAKRL